MPVSSKCGGVYTCAVSPSQTLLAAGTWHGDIIVYDLSTEPPRPVRSITNTGSADIPVVDLAWNLDGTRLLEISQTVSLDS